MGGSDGTRVANPQSNSDVVQESASSGSIADDPAASYAELLGQAKQFLQDESIKSASREQQRDFLEKKGLRAVDIEQLLQHNVSSASKPGQDMTTVHDSTELLAAGEHTQASVEAETAVPSSTKPTPVQHDAAPIITYPEFLLKPQKPPPIVTFQRLVYAGYGLAALSALTYSASKYLIEPLMHSLTEARHDLAGKALEDLEKLNDKLEASVSHVPYFASLGALKAQHEHECDDESISSDPTELFHRDIATQTSPQPSHTSSFNSPGHRNAIDVIDTHASRLASLHETLESLVFSINPSEEPFLPPSSTKKLHESVLQLQTALDKLESTYNPFRSDYNSIYMNTSSTTPGPGRGDNNEAAKFKAEIRSLKGVFLSSRNFPAARPTAYAGAGSR